MRHVGAARVLRGAATWPCVPRRIHAGPHTLFLIFFYFFLLFKIENKIIENPEKYKKIPKNCENHIF